MVCRSTLYGSAHCYQFHTIAQEPAMITTVLIWVVVGLITGLIVSFLVRMHGEDIAIDLGVGIVGAIVGGALFAIFGSVGVHRWHVLVAAIVGAAVLVGFEHAARWSVPPRFRWR